MGKLRSCLSETDRERLAGKHIVSIEFIIDDGKPDTAELDFPPDENPLALEDGEELAPLIFPNE
ncbi:MAG: hypothetical protein A2312_01660 [Candidatus Staskawiczbacteria bacterium RIFOXYB2_FULL_32_9]|nr:MAG: hypothetical protein A2312_01660 [Candidatus Staskawiczbacteria bacterium RIFOXYB2_FULL_32_9]OGZ88271.1 MAG: hypothetical protein A2463_01535 [Candidatus Staskawiczbacteria bacterium RIFOXYC2_FULL_32_10]